MEKSFKLLPPLMPNFIAYEVPARPRQEGFKPDNNRIAVSELSKEEAEQYGELMRQTFLKHWESKKHPEPPNDRVIRHHGFTPNDPPPTI